MSARTGIALGWLWIRVHLGRKVVHCWADDPSCHYPDGATCLRRWGHLGRHAYVDDDDINVQF